MESTLKSRLHRKRRRAFIESYTFPPALEVKLAKEFPDDRHVAIALEGLREWYLACLAAPGETLGMPSRAVDIAWHEMILMTRSYHAFCQRAFGHYLHHSPEAVMDEPIGDSLARTLEVLERQSPAIVGVPLLFAVDAELGIADGFVWQEHDLAHVRDARAAHAGGSCAGGTAGGGGAGCGTSCGSSCGGGGCGGGGSG
jgi:hypothetical protein